MVAMETRCSERDLYYDWIVELRLRYSLFKFKSTALLQTCNSEVVLDPRKLSSLIGDMPLQLKNVPQALLMFCEDCKKKTAV